MRHLRYWFSCIALAGLCSLPARAATEVTAWSLTTFVSDATLPPPGDDIDYSDVVQNPFVASHLTALPQGPQTPVHFANSYFAAGWDVAFSTGHFDLAFEQQINGPDSFAATSGNIYFTTDTDLLMSFAGTMHYSSSRADEAGFDLGLTLARQPEFQIIWSDGAIGDCFGCPPSGTLTIGDSDILVPAGSSYVVNYLVRSLYGHLTPPRQSVLAQGTIHFDWRPVPEPAALGLLVAGAMMLRRRTRRP